MAVLTCEKSCVDGGQQEPAPFADLDSLIIARLAEVSPRRKLRATGRAPRDCSYSFSESLHGAIASIGAGVAR